MGPSALTFDTMEATRTVRIEALRAAAAALVVLTHYLPLAGVQPGAWGLASTGVNLFFVLSGFVFAPYLLRPGFALAPHLVRRVFRLFPLYLMALLAYALLKPAHIRWDGMAAHVLMLHTLGTMELAAFYNVAFWSLPPEVEFYLALPVLAWLVARIRLRGLLMVGLAAHLALALTAHTGESPESARSLATVHLPGLLLQFAFGAAVALAPAAWTAFRWRIVSGCLAGAAGLALVLVWQAALRPDGGSSLPPALAASVGAWAALGYALALHALLPGIPEPGQTAVGEPRKTFWRVALQRLGLALGAMSYGVYLFHNAAPMVLQRAWPSLQGAGLVLSSVALTFVAAALAHRLVESPLRSFGRELAQRLTR